MPAAEVWCSPPLHQGLHLYGFSASPALACSTAPFCHSLCNASQVLSVQSAIAMCVHCSTRKKLQATDHPRSCCLVFRGATSQYAHAWGGACNGRRCTTNLWPVPHSLLNAAVPGAAGPMLACSLVCTHTNMQAAASRSATSRGDTLVRGGAVAGAAQPARRGGQLTAGSALFGSLHS